MPNFIGFDATYEKSTTVMIGAPFDGTTSNRPGTRFAPNQMRIDSYGLETYSPYLDADLGDYSLCDLGDMEFPFGNTQKVLEIIYKKILEIVNDHKKPLLIGGEHLVTFPAVKALYQKYPNLIILHFDAHTDLRDEFIGEKLSHATVLRRIWDIVGDGRIFQFGIRSGAGYEFQWAKEHTHLEKFSSNTLKDVIHHIGDTPVYLTIDLDVLDPSVFPGTGTPEGGGFTMKELLECIVQMNTLNLVAADLVELAPHYDPTGCSSAIACKVAREVALLLK